MGFRINTNIASLNARKNLEFNNRMTGKSFAKLASGSRINTSADDAAGLAISENFKAQIRSTRQAKRNANDGISLIQTAESSMNEIGNIVIRLRELGIQASSDTIGDVERGFVDKEVQQLKNEIQRVAQSTSWGSTKLLDGSSAKFDFQIGTRNDEFNDRISFDATDATATLDALGLAGIDYTSKEGAQEALSKLDSAQEGISSMRSNLGALQNRLTSTVNNLAVSEENLSAANSRIRDTDIADVSAEMTRNQILLQAATSTLSQANQNGSQALKLIG